jgi:hypothetical protein
VLSPLLSNLYLTEVDKMLERAKEVTHYGPYTYVEYCRFADDRAPRTHERRFAVEPLESAVLCQR